MSDLEDRRSSYGDDRPHTDSESTPLLCTATTRQYSIFTKSQKRLIILAAALASAFSPLSANIYFPALNSIAKDLHVTPSQINLTITTYMVSPGVKHKFIHSQTYLNSTNILDISRSRTNIHWLSSRPSWSSTRIHLLLPRLHRRQHRSSNSTLVSRSTLFTRSPKLRQQRNSGPCLRRRGRYNHPCRARCISGYSLAGEHSRPVAWSCPRGAVESILGVVRDILVPGYSIQLLLFSFCAFLP